MEMIPLLADSNPSFFAKQTLVVLFVLFDLRRSKACRRKRSTNILVQAKKGRGKLCV